MLHLRTLFHFTSALAYGWALHFDYYNMSQFLPIPGVYVSKFVWLTSVSYFLQFVYHSIGIFVSDSKGKGIFHSSFHFVARTIIGPIGVVVVILFWSLVKLDDDFVLTDMGKILFDIPAFNHIIHTLPLATAVIDVALRNHGQPAAKHAITAIGIFTLFYIVDIFYVHSVSGYWAYPILEMLTPPFRALFIAGCFGITLLCYTFLSLVHISIHGLTQKKVDRKKKIR